MASRAAKNTTRTQISLGRKGLPDAIAFAPPLVPRERRKGNGANAAIIGIRQVKSGSILMRQRGALR